MDDVDLSTLHRRNFLLMLSPSNIESITKSAGFSIPSPEVLDAELTSALAMWFTLASFGVLKHVNDVCNWSTAYAIPKGILPSEDESALHEAMRSGYYSFSVALLSHLIAMEAIVINPEGDSYQNIVDFVETRPISFDVGLGDDLDTYGDDEDE